MVQSSLATKSQSFDLVKSEIEQTIRQAESSLNAFRKTVKAVRICRTVWIF